MEPVFQSRRSPILVAPGKGGIVSCTQPIAAECGREILASGGNAVDAAIAVAAGMQLAEPCSTGLGGDCFALYYNAVTKTVEAMNGSGRSPAGLTLERVLQDISSSSSSSSPTAMPSHHPHSITVPGAAAGWCDALAKWGTMPMSTVLAPAIRFAKEGFPVSPLTAHAWNEGMPGLLRWRRNTTTPTSVKDAPEDLLMENGTRAPRSGEVFQNLALARTFESLAKNGAIDGFYGGDVGKAIVDAVQSIGGVMTMDDLLNHKTTFPAPIFTEFAGVKLWEVPPNGQGIVALMALDTIREIVLSSAFDSSSNKDEKGGDKLAALNQNKDTGGNNNHSGATPSSSSPSSSPSLFHTSLGWSASGISKAIPQLSKADEFIIDRLSALGHNSPAYLHLLIEAMRGAFADAREQVHDTEYSENATSGSGSDGQCTNSSASSSSSSSSSSLPPSVSKMLNRGAYRASLFNPQKASPNPVPALSSSDTVSFSVVDKWGNAISFINSNYMGFGSGLVPMNCGFSLQNRGANFSLVPSHPNCVSPRKRPYHTIIPAMITSARTDELFATYSNMGGFMQPQGHVQLLLNLVVFQADPQTALDMPRFCISDGTSDGKISFEDGIGEEECVKVLADVAGHAVQMYTCTSGKDEEGMTVKGWARSLFGRGQIILRHPGTGVLWAGSDGRGDGCAVAAMG